MLNMIMLGKTKKGQSGLVSLIVVAILAVVMGLVAVGFSKLMDRELRQSLDRELSTQAFYSALAGLDDARAYLGAQGTPFTTCDGWKNTAVGPKYFSDTLSNGSSIAKYSCVTIDTTPDSLGYQLNPDQSVTFEITKANLSRLYFGWQNDQLQSSFVQLGSLGSLPQTTTVPSGATGLLEVNLYPVPASGTCGGNSYASDTNSTLACLSRTYYMYPNQGAGNPSNPGTVGYASNGSFVPGNCVAGNKFQINNSTVSRWCNTFISGLNGSTPYYVRLTARYLRLNITVQAADSSGTNLGQIPGAQAVVDVTGQGTDVLQRIRARFNLNNSYQTPLYGVQSMAAICKGFNVNVPSPGLYGGSSLDGTIGPYIVNGDCPSPSISGSPIAAPAGLGPH